MEILRTRAAGDQDPERGRTSERGQDRRLVGLPGSRKPVLVEGGQQVSVTGQDSWGMVQANRVEVEFQVQKWRTRVQDNHRRDGSASLNLAGGEATAGNSCTRRQRTICKNATVEMELK